MARGLVVGGMKPRIYVVIRCRNSNRPCSIEYSIDLICVRDSTTPSSIRRSSSVSTVKTVKPTTAAPVVYTETCECHCCIRKATCTPEHIGYILYPTNKYEDSHCVSQCTKRFVDCPTNANIPGKIKTFYNSTPGIMSKNVFYISLLILLVHILT
jgi:hypothetical protein